MPILQIFAAFDSQRKEDSFHLKAAILNVNNVRCINLIFLACIFETKLFLIFERL